MGDSTVLRNISVAFLRSHLMQQRILHLRTFSLTFSCSFGAVDRQHAHPSGIVFSRRPMGEDYFSEAIFPPFPAPHYKPPARYETSPASTTPATARASASLFLAEGGMVTIPLPLTRGVYLRQS